MQAVAASIAAMHQEASILQVCQVARKGVSDCIKGCVSGFMKVFVRLHVRVYQIAYKGTSGCMRGYVKLHVWLC